MNFVTKWGALALVLSILVSGIPIRAQEAQDAAGRLNALLDTLGPLQTQIQTFNAETFPALRARRLGLESTAQELGTAVTALKTKYTELGTATQAYNAKVKKKCNKACKADGVRLAQSREDLDAAKAELSDRVTTLTQDQKIWVTDAKTAETGWHDLMSKTNDALVPLSQAARVYGACADRYPKDDDNGLRTHCGDVTFTNIRATLVEMENYKPE